MLDRLPIGTIVFTDAVSKMPPVKAHSSALPSGDGSGGAYGRIWGTSGSIQTESLDNSNTGVTWTKRFTLNAAAGSQDRGLDASHFSKIH